MTLQYHDRPEVLNLIYFKKMLNALLLLVFTYFSRLTLAPTYYNQGNHYYSLITGTLYTSELQIPDISRLYFPSNLAGIAYSNMIVATVMYAIFFLMSRKQYKTTKPILTVLSIAFAIWISLSMIFEVLNNTYGLYSDLELLERPSVRNFALSRFIGHRVSLFPITMFGIFGAIIGVLLSDGNILLIRKISYSLGSVFFVSIFVYLAFINFDVVQLFVFEVYPFFFQLANLGLMMMFSAFFIGRIDYAKEPKGLANPKRTLAIRRFGFVALSIYIYEGVVVALLHQVYIRFFGQQVFPWNPVAGVTFIILITLFWFWVLPKWEERGFFLSYEWIASEVHLMLKSTTSKLKIQESLYQVPVKETYPLIPEEHLEE